MASSKIALRTAGNDNWETPDDLYSKLNGTYSFVLDAAASVGNAKCPNYFGDGGVASDALVADWQPWLNKGNIWLNPPYSRPLQSQFVTKALSEIRKFDLLADDDKLYPSPHIVCLLPARTDTKLFHDVIWPHAQVQFLRGRLKFKGATNSAPFPSMIVVF